jgi:high-affinity iron transporter
MGPSFLLSLREGLEAALVVGIVLSIVHRLGARSFRRAVWAGVAAAVAVSLAAGFGLNVLGITLEGRAEPIFEGSTMVLAASVLTWMIFWMGRQGRQLEAGLEASVRAAVTRGSQLGLFWLALVSVLREGVELALFLTAASLLGSPGSQWLGSLLGLAVAVVGVSLLFAGGRRIRPRLFFRVTSVLLLLFAAGLVGRAVHELQEGGILPVLVANVWDLSGLLNEKGPVGALLQGLLGYNANPSLLEVIVYTAYVLAMGALHFARLVASQRLRGTGEDLRSKKRPTAGPAWPR